MTRQSAVPSLLCLLEICSLSWLGCGCSSYLRHRPLLFNPLAQQFYIEVVAVVFRLFVFLSFLGEVGARRLIVSCPNQPIRSRLDQE